jgi:hypothetical protein
MDEYLKQHNLHNLIRENILTLTRNFDKRVHAFLKHIVCGTNADMGVSFYNYRVEFQLRGAPHVHGVLWLDLEALDSNFPGIKKAFSSLKFGSVLDKPENDVLIQFIDSFITCSLQSEVADIVKDVQVHNHTKSCQKKGKVCRFNYPKFPSEYTIITRSIRKENFVDEKDFLARKDEINKTLRSVKQFLVALDKSNLDNVTLDDILQETDISKQKYYDCLRQSGKGTSIVLKRQVNEIYVNNYNIEWLRAWNGNLDIQVCLDYFAVLTYITDYYSKNDQGIVDVLKNVSGKHKDSNLKEKMEALCHAFLTHRQIGESEAFYRILPSLHLTESNVKCCFLANGFKENRTRYLRKLDENEVVPNSESITVEGKSGNFVLKTSIHEKYADRPNHMENISLARFAMYYEKINSKNVASIKSKLEKDKDNSPMPKYFALRNDLNTIFKKRISPLVLRYHSFRLDTHLHEHMYSELLFYFPWRDEKDLFETDFASCSNLFNGNLEAINNEKSSLFPHRNNMLEARQLLADLGHTDNNIGEILDSCIVQGQLDDELEPIEKHPDFTHIDTDFVENKKDVPESSKYKKIDISNIPEMEASVRQLSIEQRLVFNMVLHYCKSLIKNGDTKYAMDPPLLFVHGGAGTGKSKLIDDVAKWAEYTLTAANDRSLDQPYIIKVAPTGKAASLIDGLTMHSAFNFGFGNDFISLSDKSRDSFRTQLRFLRIVIIDEISMVKSDLLYQLHLRLQEVKENAKPFGGVSILMFGDLMQLKPVRAKWIFDTPYSNQFAQAYNITKLWDLFQFVELTKNFRQGEDGEYAELLNRVRFGRQTSEDIKKLESRIHPAPPLNYLHVFGSNKLVDQHNQKMLNATEGDNVVILAKHLHPTQANYKPNIQPNGQVADTAFMNELKIKKEAKIMLIHNVNTSDSLTNGTLGILKDFHFNENGTIKYLMIDFHDQRIGSKTREHSNHVDKQKKYTPISIVSFSYSLARPVQGTTTCQAKVLQFPIKLAWGITAHKIQGQTIPKPLGLAAHMASVFSAGQAYVILSRVQALSQLYLINFSSSQIKISLDALKITTDITRNTLNLSETFWFRPTQHRVKVASLNIRSLPRHISDLRADQVLLESNFICLSETHLPTTHNHDLEISGYSLLTASFGKGKGVAIYHKHEFPPARVLRKIEQNFQIILCIYSRFQIAPL